MNRLNRRTVRVRLTPGMPAPAGHPLLTGYRPDPLPARRHRLAPTTPAAPVAASLPAGLVGAAAAATALDLPETVLRRLATDAPDLLPPVHWVDGEPCFAATDLAARR